MWIYYKWQTTHLPVWALQSSFTLTMCEKRPQWSAVSAGRSFWPSVFGTRPLPAPPRQTEHPSRAWAGPCVSGSPVLSPASNPCLLKWAQWAWASNLNVPLLLPEYPGLSVSSPLLSIMPSPLFPHSSALLPRSLPSPPLTSLGPHPCNTSFCSKFRIPSRNGDDTRASRV